MKKFIILSFAAALMAILPAFTTCDVLIFFKAGSSITMTSYDNDGKITGSTKTDFVTVTKTDSGTVVNAKNESFDKKGKSSSTNNYSLRCNKNILYIDIKSMVPAEHAESLKNMEMSMSGADLEIPMTLTVGSTLKDGDMTFSFKSTDGSPMPPINMNIKVTNRKVIAKETVTTPAGTFECYKITEDGQIKNSMFTSKYKVISWFSYEAGNVKTESYKENGKFMSKTELTALKKG
ncbi:MAG: hypothetical protein H7321_08170 [Bacteroidia bacterium]|nr:hypothetical protein [Bacteroidia bacterium]